MRFIAGLIVGASTLACLALVGQEYRAALFGVGSEQVWIASLGQETSQVSVPMNARNMRELMGICAARESIIALRLQSAAIRDSFRANCLSLASEVLQDSPTYGAALLAHTVNLASSQDVVESLHKAQMAARYEAWQAKIRIALVFERLDPAADEVAPVLDRDLSYLLQTYWGRKWLAQLYRSTPTSRDPIKRVVEAQPGDVQAAFVNEMNRVVANGS